MERRWRANRKGTDLWLATYALTNDVSKQICILSQCFEIYHRHHSLDAVQMLCTFIAHDPVLSQMTPRKLRLLNSHPDSPIFSVTKPPTSQQDPMSLEVSLRMLGGNATSTSL